MSDPEETSTRTLIFKCVECGEETSPLAFWEHLAAKHRDLIEQEYARWIDA